MLKALAVAFTALKIVGAAYLLYLAWQAFRAVNAPIAVKSENLVSAKALYIRGILMNVTTPRSPFSCWPSCPSSQTRPAVPFPCKSSCLG